MIEKMRHSCYRPVRVWPQNECRDIPRTKPTSLENSEVPAGASRYLNLTSHVGSSEAEVQFPARLTALANFEECGAQAPLVTEADISFGYALDHEILTKSTRAKHRSAFGQIGCPKRIVADGICMDGLVWPAMMPTVPLLITHEPAFACNH
ncbi:hypothetical protein ASD64_18640 [Mesorhizobium sp. Root157]|nr:hypothetical protein ASD64_18640 [Mesorhizobium sp. Root157]